MNDDQINELSNEQIFQAAIEISNIINKNLEISHLELYFLYMSFICLNG